MKFAFISVKLEGNDGITRNAYKKGKGSEYTGAGSARSRRRNARTRVSVQGRQCSFGVIQAFMLFVLLFFFVRDFSAIEQKVHCGFAHSLAHSGPTFAGFFL